MRRVLGSLTVTLLLAAPAAAQEVSLEIEGGRVNLEAHAVPLRAILTEWSRVGGTRIVGAEKVTGAPMTLTLEGVSERQALEILMRGVAGYMAAPRGISAEAGASVYDRILILATSTAPSEEPASARTAPRGPAGTPRLRSPRAPVFQPDNESADDQAADDGYQADQQDDQNVDPGQDPSDSGAEQVFTFPQPDGTTASPPVITLQPDPNGGPPTFIAVQPESAPSGFTIIGSPAPGMIQPPPAQPNQPGGATRPPE